MFGQHSGKALAAILCATMLTSTVLPSTALAIESQIRVEDHASDNAAAQEIKDLVVGAVDAPKAGEALDDTATVRSAEGQSWDVPVLWIDQDLQLATTASEEGTYLPAIAFFVPEDYRVAASDGAYTITLSDELVKLYGTNEVVSVFDAARGITYLLPARLRDYFTSRSGLGAAAGQATAAPAATAAATETATPAAPAPELPYEPANPGSEVERTRVDIHCAKNVRDSFTDEDLEWLLDLVLNKLQPEAINLLLEKFPAFGEAAAKGEIGTEIGLYVYCLFGDKDGVPEHSKLPVGALALVDGSAVPVDGDYLFGYMVGIDISTLAKKDAEGTVVTDPTTGKWVLLREGEAMDTFMNTLVHEHFHALMFDYNRVGMTGSLKMSDYVVNDKKEFVSDEQAENYHFTRLPAWFIEGSASAVENVYAYRMASFSGLRMKNGELLDSYDMSTLVDNYVDAKDATGTPLYFDLWYQNGYNDKGETIANENSAYVMGYLATLYLGELQVRQSGKSAIIGEEGYTVSSEVLRGGINDILKRLHGGETLDEIINSISPVVDGKKAYNDTKEFQKKFIKGSFYTDGGPVEKGRYADQGDYLDGMGSTPFVKDLLNYFLRVEEKEGRENKSVNGSILFDFERDFVTPLDKTDDDRSDFLKIIESNSTVISTVSDEQALKDGGTGRSGTPGHESARPAKEDEYPIADIQTGPVPAPVKEDGAAEDVKAANADEASAPLALVPVVDAPDDATLPAAAKAATDGSSAVASDGTKGSAAVGPDESAVTEAGTSGTEASTSAPTASEDATSMAEADGAAAAAEKAAKAATPAPAETTSAAAPEATNATPETTSDAAPDATSTDAATPEAGSAGSATSEPVVEGGAQE